MILTRQQIEDGEMLPAWYYGLAYRDFMRERDVYYPLPFSYIVGLARTLRHWWDRLRSRPTWMDRHIVAVLAADR